MNSSPIFRKYLILSLATMILFLSLGYLASRLIIRFETEGDRERVGSDPAPIFATLVDQYPAPARSRALESALKNVAAAPRLFKLILVDQAGSILYPRELTALPIDWKTAALPETPLQFEPSPRGSPRRTNIIRLSGQPTQYLVIAYERSERPRRNFPLISVLSVSVAAFLGTLFSVWFFLYSMREKARLANSVISELQRGNLKARFPIKKMDEMGRAMLSFNRMADEIELLVERLKSTEQARMVVLQELAHDLRTPVASLRTLTETQVAKGAQLDDRIRAELLGLSLKEVDYFERLVEDLLFMARVSEPRYRAAKESIDVNQLLDEETEIAASRHAATKRGLRIRKELPEGAVTIPGDPHLLRRLIRNALDNALSFARAELAVTLRLVAPETAEITILDDGPGLSREAIDAFGKRRITRLSEEKSGGRLSIGFGSVIMKTIVNLHRGDLSIANRDGDGKSGAELRITLPAHV